MSASGTATTATVAICPCGAFVHPRAIFNQPGLDAINYRVGDFTTFRRALLQARPGETELSNVVNGQTVQIWRPGAEGDLALQMMEWWAYVADVLTFYNERIASGAYLRTAELPASVTRLIRLIGYRPRPGIGATGMLAAVANRPAPFTLPQGFQVQSKPGPGEQPQVFELQSATQVGAVVTGPGTAPQGVLAADPEPTTAALTLSPTTGNLVSVFLQGASSAMKAGDEILFLPAPLQTLGASEPQYFVATVSGVGYQKDQNNKPVTRIQFVPPSSVSTVLNVTHYRLLTSNQSVQVWQYPAGTNYVIQQPIASGPIQVDLNSIVRAIKLGDPIVFDTGDPATAAPLLGQIVSTTEVIYYANSTTGAAGGDPAQAPASPIAAIPILHTRISFTPAAGAPQEITQAAPATYLIRYGWKTAGPLILAPVASIGGTPAASSSGATSNVGSATSALTLQASSGGSFPAVSAGTTVLVEDANGNGASGSFDGNGALTLAAPVPTLYPPLRVLFNVLNVTRGKTVAGEVLGSGNASLAGQDFTLQNAPVTYLLDPASISGDGYSSTVQISVNGLQWSEVQSFYGQSANAQVFVTSEDEQGNTHVTFGDGEYGARLPTGVNNVTATYRYGSGAEVPDAGSLTVVLQPRPGLQAILNPVPVGGGADPDPQSKIALMAPRSVLTFNRAISLDDYEVIAAQAPGVVRASAVYAFDADEQRPGITIWVGDDAGAVTAAWKAISGAADPNRMPRLLLATQIPISINLTLVADAQHQSPAAQAALQTAVHDALLDPDTGLFGVNVVGIGQVFYDSQVFAACLSVPGVQSISSYSFSLAPGQTAAAGGQGGNSHLPLEGGYFFLPDDGNHLTFS